MLIKRRIALIWLLTFALLWCSALLSSANQEESSQTSIAIVLSRKIKPYLAALEGVESFLANKDSIEIIPFFLPDYDEGRRQDLTDRLSAADHDFLLTIGPEAARYISGSALNGSNLPVLHTMILNPGKIVGKNTCYISLNIPVSIQLSRIRTYLPEAAKIGLIYDPELNEDFYQKASRTADDMDMEVVDVQVLDREKITGVINKYWSKIDALWFIPDKTVISPSIVRYIIKEALVHQKPVIGYNRFFVRSGAAMSFIFDYRELGRQSAELARKVLAGEECSSQAPHFEIRINENVVERLNLRIKGDDDK